MKKTLIHTLRNLYTVLMCILIGLALVSVVGLKIGFQSRILITDSMYPSIYKGSLVLINTSFTWDRIEVGDVIVFRSGFTEVMHRVKESTDEGLILKPDNGKGTNFVTKDMFVGKEIVAFPYIGGLIKLVLQHGMWEGGLFAFGLIIIGCIPSHEV